MGAIKDFLTLDHAPFDDMRREDLEAECAGWRTIFQMVPSDVLVWVGRLGEAFRIITRKYEPKTGILTNIRFEVSGYSLELLEPGFDGLRGTRLVEQKILEIGQDAVLYVEEIDSAQDFEEWDADQNLAATSLDV